jgi:hypothetical protein
MSPPQSTRPDSAKAAKFAKAVKAASEDALPPVDAIGRSAGDTRASLAAQFVPAGAAVLEIAVGGAWLQRQLPAACSYQGARCGAALPPSAAKADIVVMLDVLDRVTDPDALLAQIACIAKPVVLSYRPRDFMADGNKAANAPLGFYDLTRLFDRHGLRVETTAPFGDGEMMMRLAPAARVALAGSARIAVVADRGTFSGRVGLQMLMSLLPGEAEVTVLGLDDIGAASAAYDLTVVGAGTGLLRALNSEAVLDLVSRSRAAIGIFGTQRRELIVRGALERLIGRLDAWYARDEEDLLLYGRGCRNATLLGDWLIAQWPLTAATDDEPLALGAAALNTMDADRAAAMLRRHRAVTVGGRGALLCALTAAETAAWREEGDDAAPGVPGETRGLLLDVFGRGYPEGEAFLVDRDAVRRYRTRVLGAVAALRTHIDALLGRANAAHAA